MKKLSLNASSGFNLGRRSILHIQVGIVALITALISGFIVHDTGVLYPVLLSSHTVADTVGGLLSIAFGVLCGLQFVVYMNLRRHDLPLVNPRRFQRLSFWICLFYAAATTALLALITQFTPFRDTFGSGPVILTAGTTFLGLLFAQWGLLLTYHVLRAQRSSFVGFGNFLRLISEDFESAIDKQDGDIVIYDYHPFVGVVSAREAAKPFVSLVERVVNECGIHVRILCYGPSAIPKFLRATNVRQSQQRHAISQEFQRGLKFVARNLTSNTEIWFAGDMGPFHFVLVSGVVYQYVVVPETDGVDAANTIVGHRTEDAFQAAHLRHVFEIFLARAISPTQIKFDGVSTDVVIRFEPQPAIRAVRIVDVQSGALVQEVERTRFVSTHRSCAGFRIPVEKLRAYRDFSYQLVREDGLSVMSLPVRGSSLRKAVASREYRYFLAAGENALETAVHAFLDEFYDPAEHRLWKFTVFTETADYDEIASCFNRLLNAVPDWRNALLVTVPQAPVEAACVIEAAVLKRSVMPDASIQVYRTVEEDRNVSLAISVVDDGHGLREMTATAALTSSSLDARHASGEDMKALMLSAYQQAEEFGFEPRHFVRHWHFIGGILDYPHSGVQQYQIFNAARASVFEQLGIVNGQYPAASALGSTSGYACEFFAINSIQEHETEIKYVSNKSQNDPWMYSDDVLPGAPVHGANHKMAPFFSRGARIRCRFSDWALPSGTAAVIREASQSFDTDNSERQALIASENLIRVLEQCGRSNGRDLSGLGHLRIHISRNADYSEVKKAIEPLLASVPHTYLRTDICRSDLDIELDGGCF